MRTNGFWGQIAISLRSEAKHPKGGPQAQGNLRSDPKNARFRPRIDSAGQESLPLNIS